MPYGEDPTSGYGQDPIDGTVPPVPPQPLPVQPAQTSQADQDLQAQYVARVAADPNKPQNVNREALQYKLIHPEMSFDSIEQNLGTLREQAAASRVNWQEVVGQHPVLAKLIQRDPATMQLALSEAGTLQGIQKYTGFVPDKDSMIGYRYVPGGVVESFGRGALYGTDASLYGLGRVFAATMATAEEKVGVTSGAKSWRDLEDYYRRGQQWNAERIHVDTHGDTLKDSGTFVRGAHAAAETMANLIPYAGELALVTLTGGSALAFNALMNVGQIFGALKDKGVKDEAAIPMAIGGAASVGKVMELSPLSRMQDAFSSSTTKAAMDKVLEGQAPNIARFIATGVARSGVDAASGQLALGLQRATMQAATSASGKDLKEVPAEFLRGVFTDPTLLGFHAVGLAATFGRSFRSANDARDLHKFIQTIEDAPADPSAATLREQAIQGVAAQPSARRAIYLPVDRFLEAADKIGQDPTKLAADVMQDGGTAYTIALATRSDHLKIPIEHTERAVRAGLGDTIREHGRYEQSLLSKADLEEQGLHLKKDFDAEYRTAAKLTPDNLSGQDVELYRAAQAHATLVGSEDGTAVPRLIAEVRALAKLHPEMTHKEIFDGLFGNDGIYGQQKPAPAEAPTTYRHSAAGDLEMKVAKADPYGEYNNHWTPDTFDVTRGSPDAQHRRRTELEGKGIATQLYLGALKDAQAAGKGWVSDKIRSTATNALYPRLKSLGINFVEKDGRFTLSPGDLQKVNLDNITAALTEIHGSNGTVKRKTAEGEPSPARLVELAQSLSGHSDQRWFNLFNDEQGKANAKVAADKADAAAHDALKRALVNNDRRMMDSARDDALSQAKREADKNPTLLAIRALKGDVAHLDAGQRAALTRPDGQPFRLLDKEIDSILGPGSAEALKEKLGNAITSNPEKAINARDFAQILGFEHTPQGLAERNLLWEIKQSPSEKDFLAHASQAALDARYGPDLLANPAPLMGAALDAVHTPEATDRLLGMYRALARDLDPSTRARSALTAEQWLDHARRLVGLKALEEIDPHHFAKSEGARIGQALEAADGGKSPEAARHAEAALLYHHLYLAAREATDAAGRARHDLARAARSELGVRRLGFADPQAGPDGMNAYQRAREAALVATGLSKPRPGTDYSQAVAEMIERATALGHDEYLDGINWNQEVAQKLIDDSKGWGAVTLDDVRQLHAFVRNLDNMGLKIEQARGEGNDGRSGNIARYLTNADLRAPKEALHLDRNLQASEAQSGLAGVLRTVKERLLALPKMIGMTDTPPNWQSGYLLQHLGPEGMRIQDQKREAYIRRDKIFRELYQPWKEIHDKTMLDPQVHKEAVGAIDMLDPQRKGQVDVDRVTYGWLLNLARWYGDADGRNRILRGFGLTPGKIEKVLATYLTPEQLGHVQAEKDLVDREWYPRLAEAHLRRTGNPLPKSEAASFKIGETTYRGGHVQLTYDDRAGMGLDLRRSLNDSTLGHRAVMENGFFHERAGSPAALPDLSNLTAPQTMLDMAHHLAIGDFLLDTKEVVLNPETAGTIDRYVGDNAARVLQGWLSRVATETRGGPDKIESGQRESLRAMRVVRSGLILAATSGKLTIPFAHATHPFMVGAMLHGPGYLKYSAQAFSEMLNGTINWLATGHNDFVEQAQADSPYLQLRASSTPDDIARLYFEREVAQSGAPKAAVEKAMDGIETFGTLPLREMDKVFSATIFRARYRHAMDTLDHSKFDDHDAMHEEATKLAEAEVDRSMPNFAQHAVSAFAASKGGFQSMITPLMGYYATVRDLYRSKLFEKVEDGVRRYEAAHGQEAPPWYRAAQSIKWQAALTLPVVLGLGLGAYLKGAGPKAGDDAPEWAQWNAGYWQREFWPTAGGFFLDAGRESAVRMSELHPLIGHVTERADESIGSRRTADYTPQSFLYSPFTDVGRAIEKTRLDRYSAGDAAISWGRAISPAAGLPAAPLTNIGGMIVNHEEFADSLPTNKAAQALDVLDHLTYSHQYGRSQKYQRSTPLSDLKDAVESAAKTDKGGHRALPW